jgi:DtxR family Mn-dependent transcriptional regulator
MAAVTEPRLSGSVEDYLKAIYKLTEEGTPATTGRIAERLDVAPASVTGMVKKLESASPPLAEREARSAVHLTKDGRRAALQTVRRHRLLEQFLLEVLHYRWDEIHDEAERLEHVVSQLFVERLALLLGDPEFDPHGDPIPDADLNVPACRFQRLADLGPGDTAIVRRIRDDRPELLRYLAGVGLRPGVRITVETISPLSETIQVDVDNQDVTIGLNVGEVILVAPAPR